MATDTTQSEPTPVPAAASPLPPTPVAAADVNAIITSVADTLVPGAAPHLAKLLAVELAGVSAPLLASTAKSLLESEAYSIFRRPAIQPGSVDEKAAQMRAAMFDHGSLAGARRNPDDSLTLGTAAFGDMQAQPGTAQANAIAAREAQARRAAVEQRVRETGMDPLTADQSLRVEAARAALRLATGIIMMPAGK